MLYWIKKTEILNWIVEEIIAIVLIFHCYSSCVTFLRHLRLTFMRDSSNNTTIPVTWGQESLEILVETMRYRVTFKQLISLNCRSINLNIFQVEKFTFDFNLFITNYNPPRIQYSTIHNWLFTFNKIRRKSEIRGPDLLSSLNLP